MEKPTLNSEMRQHKDVMELRQRLLAASGDHSKRRQILDELKRIELRELTAQQRDEQARHIAQQCTDT